MQINTLKLILISTTLVFFSIKCSDDTTNFGKKPYTEYSGVSSYDNNGKKISEVDDDWSPECYEIAGFGDSHICFYSIYPLPAVDTISISMACNMDLQLRMWLSLHDTTHIVDIFDGQIKRGDFSWEIPFDDELLHKDLVYRLFVETTNLKDNIKQLHYGDIIWK